MKRIILLILSIVSFSKFIESRPPKAFDSLKISQDYIEKQSQYLRNSIAQHEKETKEQLNQSMNIPEHPTEQEVKIAKENAKFESEIIYELFLLLNKTDELLKAVEENAKFNMITEEESKIFTQYCDITKKYLTNWKKSREEIHENLNKIIKNGTPIAISCCVIA